MDVCFVGRFVIFILNCLAHVEAVALLSIPYSRPFSVARALLFNRPF